MLGRAGDKRKGIHRRRCKFHSEVMGAQIAPELLSEQRFDIGFVIDNK